MTFDDFIRAGRDVDALRQFADEYYKNGKMGGTRKALLDRIAELLSPKKVDYLDDCINAPIADGACPNCHYCLDRQFFGDCTTIGETGEYTEAYELDCNYCPNCGQHLDWRGVL